MNHHTRSTSGSARVLLLASLVLSGMVLAGGMVVLLGPAGPASDRDDANDVEEVDLESGQRDPNRVRHSRHGDEEDPNTVGIATEFVNPDGTGAVPSNGLRPPQGDVLPPNSVRLEKAIDVWYGEIARSEEMRRMIQVLQMDGGVVPADLVDKILAKLKQPEFRIDAVLALGMLTDDASGSRLADLAANPTEDADVRLAALKALGESGQSAATSQVLALLDAPDVDSKLQRAAVRALGAIGGPAVSTRLMSLLVEHHDDDLKSTIIGAASKAKDIGPALTQIVQTARGEGNVKLVQAVLTIALRQGKDVDPGLRQEVLLIAQDSGAFRDIDDESAQRLRQSAITAAARMGEIDVVLGLIENDTDNLRGVALYSLRQARGDEAATKIGAKFSEATDTRIRLGLLNALAATKSRKATPQLIEALESKSVNERQSAAAGLRNLRDPAALDAILKRLDDDKEVYAIRQSLVRALGEIGHRDALKKLKEWMKSEESRWTETRPMVQRAIRDIEKGNVETTRLK